MTATMSLSSRYFDRLGLDPASLDREPTLGKLQTLQQTHLATIPFENTAQHGVGSPASLDLSVTADKILTNKRGGFCLEVNLLFAAFLRELNYDVILFPAIVYAGPDAAFSNTASHVVLRVTCHDGLHYIADVGFGEPPIHPLSYHTESFGQILLTPEGMQSKMERQTKDDSIVLFWYKQGAWIPRLQWNYTQSITKDDRMDHFAQALQKVQEPSSIFSQKLITCLLTIDRKVTLAGNLLKVTEPRFPKDTADKDGNVTSAIDVAILVEKLSSVHEVRTALQTHFGIPLAATQGLDLSKSLAADPEIWSHQ